MKKNLMLGLALITALTFVSCKPKESSYKKAYEKAQQQAAYNQTTEPVAVTPVTTVTPTQTTDNSNLRSERFNVIGGGSLKAYNVVCGSFSSLTNAQNLRNTLVNKGYSAQIAQNENGMYRVIASSFDDKNSAITSRDQLRNTYPDAWLLYRTY